MGWYKALPANAFGGSSVNTDAKGVQMWYNTLDDCGHLEDFEMALQDEKNLVEDVIQEWLLALNANDGERLKALWDQSYHQIIYIAEENNEAIFGWPSVNDYYDNLVGGVQSADWQLTDLLVDVLGDVAYAYLTFALEIRQNGLDRDMVFNGRNTIVLHRTTGQWKIIHYHESLSRDRSHDTWSWFFND